MNIQPTDPQFCHNDSLGWGYMTPCKQMIGVKLWACRALCLFEGLFGGLPVDNPLHCGLHKLLKQLSASAAGKFKNCKTHCPIS